MPHPGREEGSPWEARCPVGLGHTVAERADQNVLALPAVLLSPWGPRPPAHRAGPAADRHLAAWTPAWRAPPAAWPRDRLPDRPPQPPGARRAFVPVCVTVTGAAPVGGSTLVPLRREPSGDAEGTEGIAALRGWQRSECSTAWSAWARVCSNVGNSRSKTAEREVPHLGGGFLPPRGTASMVLGGRSVPQEQQASLPSAPTHEEGYLLRDQVRAGPMGSSLTRSFLLK